MPEWQAIETAPKDGSDMLLTEDGTIWVGSYRNSEHYSHGKLTYRSEGWSGLGFLGVKVSPTHWLPLPSLPEEREA